MSYKNEFLYARCEPAEVDDMDRPRSVWSAIHAMQDQRPEAWRAMAEEVFELRGPRDSALLMAEGVMAKIVETGAVDQRQNPARVFVDKRRRHYVEVWS